MVEFVIWLMMLRSGGCPGGASVANGAGGGRRHIGHGGQEMSGEKMQEKVDYLM